MTTTRVIPDLPDGIDLWDCRDYSEDLVHTCIHEALDAELDTGWERMTWEEYKTSLPATITVYGFQRLKVTGDMLYEPLEDVLERLDEEYGDPCSRGTDETERMQQAQRDFLRVVAEEYHCWACERVAEVEVDPVAWIQEYRPDWIEERS
jgi:hypothetical protein